MNAEPTRNLLDIHKDRLEDDAAENPKLMWDWGSELAEAKATASTAENKLKLEYARLEMQVRSDPVGCGLEKITDASVKAWVLMQVEYTNQQEMLVQAEYDRDRLQAFVNAVHERGEQIGTMSKLHGQQYWSKPRTEYTQTDQSREAAMEDLAPPAKTTKTKSKK